MAITIQSIKVEGVEYMQLVQLEISHAVNEYGRARLVLIIDEAKAKEFMQQGGAVGVMKISSKVGDNTTLMFCGYVVNVNFQLQVGYNLMTIDLCDTASLLDIKRLNHSFQKLDANYKNILEGQVADAGGTIQFKVDDKAIEKMILQLNETSWEFIKRMASQLNASVFTDITAESPMITIGLPDAKATAKIQNGDFSCEFNAAQFDFVQSNPQLLAEGVGVVVEDFFSVQLAGPFQYLNLGDVVQYDRKNYRVKALDGRFIADGSFRMTYTLVGENGFLVPKVAPKNLRGRIFRAQVKTVDKDVIQAHLVDIDAEYDNESTMKFPFATPYSSADGSGWYVMPEVDDYVRIIFPSNDTDDAFAISSINTAPLADPKNKSLKAPGGRELLLTDKGVEIIAEHQETFILLNKDEGISVVSAKDIVIHADGNIFFEANGKIQMVAKEEIAVQSGQSHVKLLSDQIDMGGNKIIVGE
ncbi:MAG: hypothetical protein SR1Q7_04870 [Quinella sp. 1Q7]|nr:hypothetical protein [Quinella sp. 1Q7]